MAREKTVGIIGGMGPAATVDFMQRVLAATPARDDSDHIHLIVDCNAKVPSRIRHLVEGGGENPGPCLAQMAQRLQAAGADLLVIPCNTAHHYYDYMAAAVDIPVAHLVELTLAAIKKDHPEVKKIGMLASTAIIKTGLYERFCTAAGVALVYPENQGDVMAMIKAVKAGVLPAKVEQNYRKARLNLATSGADVLVYGCTELSALVTPVNPPLPQYDTLDILAAYVVRCVKGVTAP